jgi:hypothetical protein
VLCAAFVWGVPIGYFIEDVGQAIEEVIGRRWPNAVPILMIHLVVLWYAVIPLLLARVTPRMRWVLLAAIATNLGIFCASFARSMVGRVGFGADPSVPMVHSPQFIAFFVTSAIAAAVAIAVWWLYRWLRFVPVEQREDGSLCIACGYEMGAADPCPECGTTRADARPRGRRLDAAWRWIQRAARPVLVVIVLFGAGYAAWRVAVDYLPTRRFVERFDTGGSAAYAYVDSDQIHLHTPLPNSIGHTINLNDGTGRMILVSFHPRPPEGLAAMQVRVCAPATHPPGWPVDAQRMTDWGMPGTVVADLNREQAERVIREGLPRGLVEAIVAKADEVGWKAGGGINNMGGQRFEVDAGPHFETEREGE